MSGRLAGKAALVTGASRGIGAAIAKRLALEGADVVITYVGNKGAADEVIKDIQAKGRNATALQADVADPAAVRAVVDAGTSMHGGLDILVHNAGLATYMTLSDSDAADYLDAHRRQSAVNVDGIVALTAAECRICGTAAAS